MLLNLVSYIDFCIVFTTQKRSEEHQETLGEDGHVYYLENDGFHECTHRTKLIKLCTVNTCSILYQ